MALIIVITAISECFQWYVIEEKTHLCLLPQCHPTVKSEREWECVYVREQERLHWHTRQGDMMVRLDKINHLTLLNRWSQTHWLFIDRVVTANVCSVNAEPTSHSVWVGYSRNGHKQGRQGTSADSVVFQTPLLNNFHFSEHPVPSCRPGGPGSQTGIEYMFLIICGNGPNVVHW